MADATVKTVQYVDPRIEPQPDPVYDYVIGPTQNQYYRIGASGLSNASINFNNLTTLGVDRAYLDTFEIELTVTFDFLYKMAYSPTYTSSEDGTTTINTPAILTADDYTVAGMIGEWWYKPNPSEWTFQSFPFNTVCEQARVNINGGAFFSEPMAYIRAKERYMNQKKLSNCYENICPIHRPMMQTESGRSYDKNYDLQSTHEMLSFQARTLRETPGVTMVDHGTLSSVYEDPPSLPTRLGKGMYGAMQSEEGLAGGFNNQIFKLGAELPATLTRWGWENFLVYRDSNNAWHSQITVTWREPIFVSPFSSRYDATYGRPLYNITSMDLTFNLCDLTNMLRVCNLDSTTAIVKDNANPPVSTHASLLQVDSYSATIKSAFLCYQVMTIPPTIQKPLTTLVPYRRFVPYITDYNQSMGPNPTARTVPIGGGDIELGSGVFTLNEIPTAIWIYTAPSKTRYQHNVPDTFVNNQSLTDPAANHNTAGSTTVANNWDSNKLFGGIKHLEISMANTTQILSTAQISDLYRIAKANGCEDSFVSWSLSNPVWPRMLQGPVGDGGFSDQFYYGAGSVLRLKPGVDIILPDQQLIPGANANNMVFYCSGKWYIPPHSTAQTAYSLWILFEYVGVAAISPGQCEISMNPLGSGEIMSVSPVMSATSIDTEGTLEGSGFWDSVKRGTRIAGQIANEGILSRILKHIPHAEKAAEWAAMHGLGAPASKRKRDGDVSGGAVIGKGLGEWV